MALTQQGKERRALQGWIAFELRDHPGPVFLKRILTGIPVMGALELRGKLPPLFVFAGSAFTHARSRRRKPLRASFSSLLHIQSHFSNHSSMTLTS